MSDQDVSTKKTSIQKTIRKSTTKPDASDENEIVFYSVENKTKYVEAKKKMIQEKIALEKRMMKDESDGKMKKWGDATDEKKPEILPEPFKYKEKTYTFIKKLGQGSNAKVYEVKDEQNNLFAFKIIDTSSGYGVYSDCQIMKLAESIQSPHICKVYAAGQMEKKNKYFCVLDLLGSDLELKDIVGVSQTSKLSVTTKLVFAKQTLKAIEDLHKLQFLHCDVKANNFALGRSGTAAAQTIFIIDFGLTEVIEEDRKKDINRENADEIIVYRKYDLVSWLHMVAEWFGVELIDEFLGKKEEKEGCPEKMKKNLILLEKLPKGFEFIYLYIRELQPGPVDFEFIYKIIDLTFKLSQYPSPITLEFDSNNVYHEPEPSLTEFVLNDKFRPPFYAKNQHNKIAVSYLGDIYSIRPDKKMGGGPQTVTVFRCRKDNDKCNRRLEVFGFNKERINYGDVANVIRVINPHRCSLKKRGPLCATTAPSCNDIKEQIDLSVFFE